MKYLATYCFLSIFIFFGCNQYSEIQKPFNYFNQQPPGFQPERFAPHVFNQSGYMLHGYPTFSHDAQEVYWPVVPPRIFHIKQKDAGVSAPQIASFAAGNMQAPFYAPDPDRIYFQLSHKAGCGSLDICCVEKMDTTWGAIATLPMPPNSPKLESQPSLSHNGNLYFTGFYEKGMLNRGIYKSRYKNDTFMEPELLPEMINTPALDYTSFIAPDESFLLFASTREGEGEEAIRLFVSFHNADDTWTEPVNLNRMMQFDQPSRFPCLTPDGMYIIFQSDSEYYWVSAEILEQCKV